MSIKVNLSGPDITEKEIQYVIDVLKTPYLSLGPKLPEFEEKVADYVGSKYAVAVNSGTSGLHLLVKALGFNPGDEVITSPFSFVASSNCLLYEDVRPVFVDIDPQTYNLDIEKVRETLELAHSQGRGDKIKGILPVHVFGQPCDMDAILKLADEYNLKVIEDSCEAIGARYQFKETVSDKYTKGQWANAGTMGDAGVFAFYPNKQITTGEGGVIVTDDENVAELCKSMRNQGRGGDGKWLAHVRLGYNYRLSDINCALGIAQVERLDEILEKRNKAAQLYNKYLADVKGVRVPFIADNVDMSWFVYVVQLDSSFSQDDRSNVMKSLLDNGIGCNNYFPPIHLQPFYMDMFGCKTGDFPVTEFVSDRTIALPFYTNIQESDIEFVCSILLRSLK